MISKEEKEMNDMADEEERLRIEKEYYEPDKFKDNNILNEILSALEDPIVIKRIARLYMHIIGTVNQSYRTGVDV